jgi:hypothetical protein
MPAEAIPLRASAELPPPSLRLTQLTVRNFRNLASLDVELPPEGAVIIGGNGEGKTNLLEAMYYLVLFKSFRGARDRELVRFGEAGFFVAGVAGQRMTAGYEVAGRRKKVTVSGQEVSRLADAVGTATGVVFSPHDREIIDAGPSARRRYLDILLSLSVAGATPRSEEGVPMRHRPSTIPSPWPAPRCRRPDAIGPLAGRDVTQSYAEHWASQGMPRCITSHPTRESRRFGRRWPIPWSAITDA